MPEFDFDVIAEEADRRWYQHQHSGPRGQLVTEKDGPEFWYALVAYEWATADKRE